MTKSSPILRVSNIHTFYEHSSNTIIYINTGTIGTNLPSSLDVKWRHTVRNFFRKSCAHCGMKAERPWHVNLKIFRLCKKCGDVWDSTETLPLLSLERHNKIISKFDRLIKQARLGGGYCHWWHVYIREEAKRLYIKSTVELDVESCFGSADDEEEEEEDDDEEEEESKMIEVDEWIPYSSDKTFNENEDNWRMGENVVWVNRRNGVGTLRWNDLKYGTYANR